MGFSTPNMKTSPPLVSTKTVNELKMEREEGEISDEFEDISSDEEITMRQRIEQLEERNNEMAEIAFISTKCYDSDVFADFPEYSPPPMSPPKRRKKLKKEPSRVERLVTHEIVIPKKHKVRSKILAAPAKSTKKRSSSHNKRRPTKTPKLKHAKTTSSSSKIRYVASSSDEEEFHLSRDKLKEALRRDVRDIAHTKTTLKMKLAPTPIENVITNLDTSTENESAEEMELEEMELRMLALQSKLYRGTKLERPYSPTDNVLDIGDLRIEQPLIVCEDSIQDISVNMEISPLGSPGFEDRVLQPIDMDIASDSNDEAVSDFPIGAMLFSPQIPLDDIVMLDQHLPPPPPLPLDQPIEFMPPLPDVIEEVQVVELPIPDKDVDDEETEALRAVLLSRPKLKVKSAVPMAQPDSIPVSSNLKEALKRFKKRSISSNANNEENTDTKENINCNKPSDNEDMHKIVQKSTTKTLDDGSTEQIPPTTTSSVHPSVRPLSNVTKDVIAPNLAAIRNLSVTAVKLRQKSLQQKRAAEASRQRQKLALLEQLKPSSKKTPTVAKKVTPSDKSLTETTQSPPTKMVPQLLLKTPTKKMATLIVKKAVQTAAKKSILQLSPTDATGVVVEKVVPPQSKSLRVPDAKPVKQLIIRVGESDSDSEDTESWKVANIGATSSNAKEGGNSLVENYISVATGFEQRLDQFLKTVRSKVQKDPVTVKTVVKSSGSVAVSHLPPSSQLEYNRLIKRMKQLEKQKQARLAEALKLSPLSNNNNNNTIKEDVNQSTPMPRPTTTLPFQERLDTTIQVSIPNNGNSSPVRRIDIDPTNRIVDSALTVRVMNDLSPAKRKSLTLEDSGPSKRLTLVQEEPKTIQAKSASTSCILPKSLTKRVIDVTKVPEEGKKPVLGKVEKEYVSHGKVLINDIDEILGLVCKAQLEKQRQQDLENELVALRQQMVIKEKMLEHQKSVVVQLYPKISSSHQNIVKNRDIFSNYHRKCSHIGQTLNGSSYKLPSQCKDQIVAKLRKLSMETKKLKQIKLASSQSRAIIKNAAIEEITEVNKVPSDVEESACTKMMSNVEVPCDTNEDVVPNENHLNELVIVNEAIITTDICSSPHVVETVVSTNPKMEEDFKLPIIMKENASNSTSSIVSRYISPLEHMHTGSTRPADPDSIICPYQLNGQCEDKECQYQHLL